MPAEVGGWCDVWGWGGPLSQQGPIVCVPGGLPRTHLRTRVGSWHHVPGLRVPFPCWAPLHMCQGPPTPLRPREHTDSHLHPQRHPHLWTRVGGWRRCGGPFPSEDPLRMCHGALRLPLCTSRHPCLQTRVGSWRHVGAGVPFPKRAARCVYQGGSSLHPHKHPAPHLHPERHPNLQIWVGAGAMWGESPFPAGPTARVPGGIPLPCCTLAAPRCITRATACAPCPGSSGLHSTRSTSSSVGVHSGGRAAGGPSSSRRGLPLRRQHRRSPRAGRDFPYASPSPLETLDRPDLLFQLLAPCLGAGGSPQACLINRLYSAKAVNLSRPLRFALFNVFSCL